MYLIKSLGQRKVITLFFIISFTIAILTFSVGSSAIISQKNKAKEYNPDNNKFLAFSNCKDINFDEIVNKLKGTEISITLSTEDKDLGLVVESRILASGAKSTLDFSDGRDFTQDEKISSEKKALFSTRFNEKTLILSNIDKSHNVEVEKVGSFYELSKTIIITYGTFKDLYYMDDINQSAVSMIIRGDKKVLEKYIGELNKYVSEKNINNKIDIYPYMTQDASIEGKALQSASITIILITILNSISISSLWVKSRKKEIILRKVFGASDNDIAKIFFSEILLISAISLIFALVIQILISKIFNGSISTIDIRVNIQNFMYSSLLAITTSLLVTIPSLKYIKKIQPIEMLREE